MHVAGLLHSVDNASAILYIKGVGRGGKGCETGSVELERGSGRESHAMGLMVHKHKLSSR